MLERKIVLNFPLVFGDHPKGLLVIVLEAKERHLYLKIDYKKRTYYFMLGVTVTASSLQHAFLVMSSTNTNKILSFDIVRKGHHFAKDRIMPF